MRFNVKPRWRVAAGLLVVLLLALAIRLQGLSFGLPALYDPDEPIFVLTAMKLLRDASLNPHWFGHPGTTTIYGVAIVEAISIAVRLMTGQLRDVRDLMAQGFADPSILFMPARYFIVFCGLVVVWASWFLSKKLSQDKLSPWLTALFVSILPIMVKYSQIVRSDMQATIFVLLIMRQSLLIMDRDRTRDYVLAGIWLGLGLATKWPTGVFAVTVASAIAWRMYQGELGGLAGAKRIALFLGVGLVTLFCSSPFVFLDFSQVVIDLGGEAQASHLSASGPSFTGNIGWYLTKAIYPSLGVTGAVFVIWGIASLVSRSSGVKVVVLPALVLFVAALAKQNIVWERWMVPLMPFAAMAMAEGVVDASKRLAFADRFGLTGSLRTVLLGVIAAMSPLVALYGFTRERDNDTRKLAVAWLKTHAAPHSVITIEHLEFNLLHTTFDFLYPLGDAGCLNVRKALASQTGTAAVARWRGKRTIIDIGTVNPALIDGCVGNYALFVNYDRYLKERADYPQEVANYERLIAAGRISATFRPQSGQVGGPIVRIVSFDAPAPLDPTH